MNQPERNDLCAHCGARLRANSNSQMCRGCRLRSHREFGECDKCSESLSEFNVAATSTG